MSAPLAKTGSHTSVASTNSVDSSSHDHILNHLRPIQQNLSSWLHESWAPLGHRHERIAVGNLSLGMAVMTREMMEMHIHQAPNLRGMLDALPTRQSHMPHATMYRPKLATWPLTKHEAMVARQFAV